MLRGAGYVSITSTMNPFEVCELHHQNHYDLILLDLQMPGMDGFQVMEGLKELAARIMTICDVYDALRSKRPYKPAFDHQKTMELLTRGDGRTQPEHFDPVILAVFQQNNETFRDIFEAYAA